MTDGVKFEDLKGRTLSKIENIDNAELIFTCDNGEQYRLYHYPDCCESVLIDDICGHFEDLINSPILLAEEVIHHNEEPTSRLFNPELSDKEYEIQEALGALPELPARGFEDSFTWTFYKLATNAGAITIRWYGQSNGYYSETVDFEKVG